MALSARRTTTYRNKHAPLALTPTSLVGKIGIPDRVDGDRRAQIRELLPNVTEVMGAIRASPHTSGGTLEADPRRRDRRESDAPD